MRALTANELNLVSGGSEATHNAGQQAGKAAGEALCNTIEFAAAVIGIIAVIATAS